MAAIKFRVAVGQFREAGDEDLAFCRQMGVSGITLNRPALETQPWRQVLGKFFPNKPNDFQAPLRWEFMELVTLRNWVESFGLKLEAIENTPMHFYDKCMLGLPGADEQIENYKHTIRNLGAAGIRILGYHWMPNHVWRTTRNHPGRGGAAMTAYDHEIAVKAPPTHGRVIDDKELWSNYERFITAVLPVAEEAGVTLALHPDDPPVESLGGIARIMRDQKGFERAMAIGDSRNHALDFCMGTWSQRSPEEMFRAMEHFGRDGRLAYVHFRNVEGCVPRFNECFVDEGTVDVVRALRTLIDVGFDGFLIDDHVPHMAGDTVWGHRARAFATGYIRGLVRAVESMT